MAHECPECGCRCYCHGDIDDLVLDSDFHVNNCTCCPFDDEDDADDGYDWDREIS